MISNEKIRRESYERLYGLRFPKSKVYDSENSSGVGDGSISDNQITGQ